MSHISLIKIASQTEYDKAHGYFVNKENLFDGV